MLEHRNVCEHVTSAFNSCEYERENEKEIYSKRKRKRKNNWLKATHLYWTTIYVVDPFQVYWRYTSANIFRSNKTNSKASDPKTSRTVYTSCRYT